MNATYSIFPLLMCAGAGFSQGLQSERSPLPAPMPVPPMLVSVGSPGVHEDWLDANYEIQLHIARDGTNRFECQCWTAKRTFAFSLDKPGLSLKGTITPQSDGKVFAEYALASSGPNEPSQKPSNKTQSNNQMVNSGLFSFIFKSALSYGPSQQIKEEEQPKPATLSAGVKLSLDTPMTIFSTGKDTYRLKVTKAQKEASAAGQRRVRSAQFSPDGQRVVTASEDGTAQIWNVASGKPLVPARPHWGAWQLVSTKYGNATSFTDFSSEQRRIKLITGSHFVWVQCGTADRKVQTSAGGTYTLKDGAYTETIDFAGEGMTDYLGKPQVFKIQVEGDKLHQSGELSDGTKIEEMWQRVK